MKSLERQRQRQLDVPWITRRQYLSKPCAAQRPLRQEELRCVERIEELGTKRQIHPFRKCRGLVGIEIEVLDRRTGDNVSPCIAVARTLCDEARDVEPLLYRVWRALVRIANHIGQQP